MKTMRHLLICLAFCLCCGLLFAQTAAPAAQLDASIDATAISVEATGVAAPNDFKSSPEVEGATQSRNWTWHVQSTAIEQMNAPFSAKYSGPNSLPTSVEGRETLSMDFYTGTRLWPGAELRVDMMTWQGFGLDTTLGIDDFPNGEAYKAGTSVPHENVARFFIRQSIGLGGEKENIADDQLNLAGSQNASRLTFTLGRFSCKDIFDTNSYANDPRTQFMNWALVANVGWDYPADSLGYTTGMAVELNHPKWALRYGFFQLPNQRNGFTADGQILMWPGDSSAGDEQFFHDWGMVVEHERRYSIHAHPGVVRLLGYVNQANMGSYQAALSAPGTNIDLTHALRHTSGVGLNIEQEITKNIGVFSRLGWNDGHNEAWMFTDVNHTGSVGVSIKGESWHRPDDTIGVAGVVSGISKINQEFLAAGGTGILDGDGALQYAKEKVLETYYDCKLSKHLRGALDYQFVADPAFNSNRGPVSVFATRLHFEY